MVFYIIRYLNILLFMPLSIMLMIFLYLINIKKIRQGINMRWPIKGKLPWLNFDKNTQPYWIHCASGEFEYAKPLIRELKSKDPNCVVIVTYFSPSYKKAIENEPQVDFSTPLPWDLPGVFSQFVRYHNPRLLMVARTDLWPEMLYQCKSKNIPSLLFSATGEKKSFLTKIIKSSLLSKVDHIYAVSEEDKKYYLDLVPDEKISVIGDTKYDQVTYRLNHPRPLIEAFKPTKKCIIAGSTWPEDESVVLAPIVDSVQNYNLQLIIAPHEISKAHILKLTNYFEDKNLKTILYSNSNPTNSYDVLIVDQVGVLAELYTWAHMAFVGGSFKSKVHSVMEPLGAGCITLVGPYYKNNRETMDFLKVKINSKLSFVNSSKNKEDVSDFLKDANEFILSENNVNSKDLLKNKIQSLSGATKELVQRL